MGFGNFPLRAGQDWIVNKALIKLIRQIFGWMMAGVFLWFLCQSVIKYMGQIGPSGLFPTISNGVLTLGILFLWLLTFELGSEWILRRSCLPICSIPWYRTAFAFYYSFLMRYIPGKVWTVMSRVEALTNFIPAPVVLRCVLYEQLHLNAATAICAALLLPGVLGSNSGLDTSIQNVTLVLIVVSLLIWLLFPKQLFDLFNAVLRRLHAKAGVVLSIEGPLLDWHVAFGIFLIVTALQALALYPLINSFFPNANGLAVWQWLHLLGMYPVARLIGQLSVIGPGGVGVREGAYVILVLPVMNDTVSPIVVAWVRVLSIVPETVYFLLWWIILRCRNRLRVSG